jgi:hypothetical protein
MVQAAGRGYPWVNLQESVLVEAGEGPLAGSLGGEPRALAAADLDEDGVPDLVVSFGGAGGGQLALPGTGTALAAGDMNRRDGLENLVVGLATPPGPQLLVFEGPEGALHATPEVLSMPGAVRVVAVGSVVSPGLADLVVAAGTEVLIVHGQDRKLSLDPAHQAAVPPARQTRQTFGVEVVALALGDFRWVSRTEIAVLDATLPSISPRRRTSSRSASSLGSRRPSSSIARRAPGDSSDSMGTTA